MSTTELERAERQVEFWGNVICYGLLGMGLFCTGWFFVAYLLLGGWLNLTMFFISGAGFLINRETLRLEAKD